MRVGELECLCHTSFFAPIPASFSNPGNRRAVEGGMKMEVGIFSQPEAVPSVGLIDGPTLHLSITRIMMILYSDIPQMKIGTGWSYPYSHLQGLL